MFLFVNHFLDLTELMTAKFRKHIPTLVKDVAPEFLYPIYVGQRCSHALMHARLSRTDRIPKECVVGQCHAAASGKGEAEPQRHLKGSKLYY